MKYSPFFFSLLVLLTLNVSNAEPLNAPSRVLWIPVHGTIELGLAPYIQRAIQYAEDKKFDYLILDIDTFGGRVDAAVMIRDALIDAKVPTAAWVHKRAISAGALISLACKKVFFSPASTMGAATPIQLGDDGAKPVEEKFVSYFRAEMGATAERHGRDKKIAEAMVRADSEMKGFVKKGEVLTLTDKSAAQLKFGDGTAETSEEVLKSLKLEGAKIENLEINWAEKIVRLVTDPTISSTLMTIGTLGMIIEFQIPGFGLPGIISIIAYGLFFFGKFIVNLAGWEEVILFTLGILLLATELILIPGKMIPGILGMIFIFTALFLAGISPKVPFDWSFPEVQTHITNLSVVFILTLVGLILAYWWISKNPSRSPLVLQTELATSDGYSSNENFTHLVGKTGVATSTLKPSGKANIDGSLVEVITDGEFIEEGSTIVVNHIEGRRIVVKQA